MKKIWTIAKWEYFEKVKTKTFLISIIITPVIIIVFSLLPTLLSDEEMPRVKTIGVIDTSGGYFNLLREELEEFKIENQKPQYLLINLAGENKSIDQIKMSANSAVLKGKLEAYISLEFPNLDSLVAEYRSESIGNFRDVGRIERAINSVRIQKKLQQEGIPSELAWFIQTKIKLKHIKVEGDGFEGKQDFLITFFSSFIFILLLMMMVVYSGQMLVRSMLEERSNRLIEVLVSSSTPEELLAGKVIGLSSLGFTQILIWFLIGLTLAGSSLIPLGAFENILPMLIYFVLGFLFYTTLFVGIGSVVTTEQEAQQITTYISLVLLLPVVIAMPAIQNPDFIVIKIFSYIPFTIPSVMLLRLNISHVTTYEIIFTTLLMLLSIIIMIKVSAKIFRIGILSYGIKPTFKDIVSWINEK
jgi:ABC-2 type transport system permease protein